MTKVDALQLQYRRYIVVLISGLHVTLITKCPAQKVRIQRLGILVELYCPLCWWTCMRYSPKTFLHSLMAHDRKYLKHYDVDTLLPQISFQNK